MAEYAQAIVGGRVVDGTCNTWFCANVGVKDGRSAALGRVDHSTADRVVDARDMVLYSRGKR